MATVVLNLRQRNVFQETVLRYLNSSTPGCIVVRLGGYSTDDAIAELNKHLSASWLSNFPSTVTHRLVLHGAGGPRHAGSPLLEYRQGATNHGNSLVVTVHPLPLGCVGFLKPLSIRSGSHAVPLSTTEAEQRIAKLPWHGVVDRALLPYDEVVHGPISLEVRIGHPVAAGDHAGWDAEHSTYAFRTMSPDVHLHEESTQLDFKSGCGDAKHPQLFSSPRTLTSKLSCLPELLNGSEAAQSGVFLVYGVTDDKGKPHTALGMLQDKASCSTCTISHEYFVDLLSSMNEELHASLFPPLPPNSGCLTLHEVQDCCTAVLSGDDIGDGDNSDDSNDSSELVVHFFSEEAAAAAHLRNALDGHGAVLYAPQHAQPFAIVSEAATPSHKDALRLPSAQLQQLVIDQGWQHLKRYVVVLHLTPPPAHVGSFFSTMRNASPPSAPVYETGPGGPRAAWLSRVGMWMRMRTEPEPHAHARLVGSGYTKLCIGPDDTQQLVRRYLVGEDVTFAARFTDIVSDEDQRKRARNTLMGDRLRQRLIVADLAAVLDGNALALINEDAGIGRGNPGSSIVILSRQLLTRTVCKALIPKLQVLRSHCTILDLAFVGLPGPSEPDFSHAFGVLSFEDRQHMFRQWMEGRTDVCWESVVLGDVPLTAPIRRLQDKVSRAFQNNTCSRVVLDKGDAGTGATTALRVVACTQARNGALVYWVGASSGVERGGRGGDAAVRSDSGSDTTKRLSAGVLWCAFQQQLQSTGRSRLLIVQDERIQLPADFIRAVQVSMAQGGTRLQVCIVTSEQHGQQGVHRPHRRGVPRASSVIISPWLHHHEDVEAVHDRLATYYPDRRDALDAAKAHALRCIGDVADDGHLETPHNAYYGCNHLFVFGLAALCGRFEPPRKMVANILHQLAQDTAAKTTLVALAMLRAYCLHDVPIPSRVVEARVGADSPAWKLVCSAGLTGEHQRLCHVFFARLVLEESTRTDGHRLLDVSEQPLPAAALDALLAIWASTCELLQDCPAVLKSAAKEALLERRGYVFAPLVSAAFWPINDQLLAGLLGEGRGLTTLTPHHDSGDGGGDGGGDGDGDGDGGGDGDGDGDGDDDRRVAAAIDDRLRRLFGPVTTGATAAWRREASFDLYGHELVVCARVHREVANNAVAGKVCAQRALANALDARCIFGADPS